MSGVAWRQNKEGDMEQHDPAGEGVLVLLAAGRGIPAAGSTEKKRRWKEWKRKQETQRAGRLS